MTHKSHLYFCAEFAGNSNVRSWVQGKEVYVLEKTAAEALNTVESFQISLSGKFCVPPLQAVDKQIMCVKTLGTSINKVWLLSITPKLQDLEALLVTPMLVTNWHENYTSSSSSSFMASQPLQHLVLSRTRYKEKALL